jgi:hypothetical protein
MFYRYLSEGRRTTAITPRGQQRAKSLLRELYVDHIAGARLSVGIGRRVAELPPVVVSISTTTPLHGDGDGSVQAGLRSAR